mgnify:CR=1 FL=1
MEYEDFLKRVLLVHSDKYHYMPETFLNDRVSYVCKIHGLQNQSVKRHLMGYGCIKCSYVNRLNPQKKYLKDFLEKAVEVHGNKYDYSKFVYVTNKIKGIIICKACSNEWLARPDMFLNKKVRLSQMCR